MLGLGRSPGVGNGNSSILAWRSLWTEEPGRLQSMVCKELDITERQSSHTYLKFILESFQYIRKNTQFFTELRVYRLWKSTPSFS